MVRAPCCEKMGLKKGPWTADEDQVLVSHIKKYGHGNWRALPKQAGLLRCGKSCRLRWMNYLRPDIKRGNFSKEEEEAIIRLHAMLGNRWSAIAAKLPGRTDNEIKNVWHTHLKKMVAAPNTSTSNASEKKKKKRNGVSKSTKNASQLDAPTLAPISPERSCSSTDFSSCRTDSWSPSSSSMMSADVGAKEGSFCSEALEFPEIDESFWADALSMDLAALETPPCDPQTNEDFGFFGEHDGDDMEFWRRVFVGAEEDVQQVSQAPQLISLD